MFGICFRSGSARHPRSGLPQATAFVLALIMGASVQAQPATDSMHQRVRPCLSCHTGQTIQMASGYAPRLRGKPAGYLFNQLLNFRDGRRVNASMLIMVGHLSDAYLWEMASYFSKLEAPYPKPAPPPADPAVRARGRQLVRHGDQAQKVPACQACHGQRLTGVEPNTPSLLGLPKDYLVAQLEAWRTGARHAAAPDCMHTVATRLRESDIQAVAAWLAARPIPEDTQARTKPIANPPLECGSVSLPGK